MKIISMKSVVGSDTLCVSRTHRDCFTLNEPIYEKVLSSQQIEVKQDYWMSTANNLVIPEGLVCDIRFIHPVFGLIFKYGIPSHSLFLYKNTVATRVAYTQEGYCYEWEK